MVQDSDTAGSGPKRRHLWNWLAFTGAGLFGCAPDSVDYSVFLAVPGDAGVEVPTQPTAQPAQCGDGTVQRGEECDDGDIASGDGCSSTCTSEDDDCGNGTVNRGEECDDGNTASSDGCSAACTVETPTVCGGGTVNRGEECDDGNAIAGDGCDALCLREEPAGTGGSGPSSAGGAGGTTGGAGGAAGGGGGTSLGGTGGMASTIPAPLCLPLPLPEDVDPVCRCLDLGIDLDVNALEDCAQTLVQNSQFVINTDGWSAPAEVTTTWTERSLGAKTSSGSLGVTMTLIESEVAGRAVSGSWQCVPVAPGQFYLLHANFFVEAGEPESTLAGISAFYFASADCSGTFSSVWQSPGGDIRGGWGEISGAFLTPFDSRSLRLRLNTSKLFVDPAATIAWDNILLAPRGLCGNGTIDVKEQCEPPSTVYCSSACRTIDPCRECQKMHCGPEVDACVGAFDQTADGTYRSTLCRDLFECVRETECALVSDEACYCGLSEDGLSVDTGACLDGVVAGECRAPVEAAAESTNPFSIALRYHDSSLAVGRAFDLVPCSLAMCPLECGPRPICGNGGPPEFGEACEDGNTENGDGCSALCQSECGNGLLDGGEECEPPHTETCDDTCHIPNVCGNSVLEFSEDCDDGNVLPGDGCSADCTNECGNGAVGAGEECEPPGVGACNASCQTIVCGDGALEGNPASGDVAAYQEECDDGNTLACDGCDAFCLVESCGNGRVECSEECDPPTPGSCNATCVGDPCPACEQFNCLDELAEPLLATPEAEAILACVRASGCAGPPSFAVDVCYCGAGVPLGTCQSPNGAQGACRAEIEVGAGTTDPLVISELFVDPSVPLGAALRLIRCDQRFCQTECFP